MLVVCIGSAVDCDAPCPEPTSVPLEALHLNGSSFSPPAAPLSWPCLAGLVGALGGAPFVFAPLFSSSFSAPSLGVHAEFEGSLTGADVGNHVGSSSATLLNDASLV